MLSCIVAENELLAILLQVLRAGEIVNTFYASFDLTPKVFTDQLSIGIVNYTRNRVEFAFQMLKNHLVVHFSCFYKNGKVRFLYNTLPNNKIEIIP